jgi:hypothetical protein
MATPPGILQTHLQLAFSGATERVVWQQSENGHPKGIWLAISILLNRTYARGLHRQQHCGSHKQGGAAPLQNLVKGNEHRTHNPMGLTLTRQNPW